MRDADRPGGVYRFRSPPVTRVSEETIRAVAIMILTALALVGTIALAWAPEGDGAGESRLELRGALYVLIPAAADSVLYAARKRRTGDPPRA